MRVVDLTGKRFGKLRVLYETDKRTKNKNIIWLCQCDCGVIKGVSGSDLKYGNTISCGCMSSRLTAGDRTRTHGMRQTKIYNGYRAMRNRCYNVKQKSYKDYGAKGIKVCEAWKTFEGFYADMGATYRDGLTIERIDNQGNYCPENCKWIPKAEQAQNKTNINLVEYSGEIAPLMTICKKYNLNYKLIYARMRRGWDFEKAVNKEPRRNNKGSQ
jgi:hypothetical protein